MIRTLFDQLCDIASLLAGPQHPFDMFNEPADELWLRTSSSRKGKP